MEVNNIKLAFCQHRTEWEPPTHEDQEWQEPPSDNEEPSYVYLCHDCMKCNAKRNATTNAATSTTTSTTTTSTTTTTTTTSTTASTATTNDGDILCKNPLAFINNDIGRLPLEILNINLNQMEPSMRSHTNTIPIHILA